LSATEPHVHVVRFAPAKLNLTLAVTGRRADGYHALHSIMVPLSLGDALTVRVAGASATCDSLRVSGLPLTSEPDNLILRAVAGARELARDAATPGSTTPGAATPAGYLAVRLSKRIPVAAGLGGGSSDAAAAIDAALSAWGVSLPSASLDSLAASLGSDVPFFRAGRGAVVTGRGECVEPLPVIEEPPAVLLVTPRLAVSTAAVFRAYAAGHRPKGDMALRISEALAADLRDNPSPLCLLERAAELAIANDLGRAAVATAPGLAEFTAALGRLLERPVCQSGSGPSLWVLYPTLEDARRAARAVRQAAASGKVPGFGDGEPFVAATLISMGPHRDPSATALSVAPEGSADPARFTMSGATNPSTEAGT
jgi:4-diphosphocytidyl-2-C-methyl-D-erythritol kinase